MELRFELAEESALPRIVTAMNGAATNTVARVATKPPPHQARHAYAWFADVTVGRDPVFHGKQIGAALDLPARPVAEVL